MDLISVTLKIWWLHAKPCSSWSGKFMFQLNISIRILTLYLIKAVLQSKWERQHYIADKALGGRELIQQASLDCSIRGFSILHRWQHSYRALTFITVKSLKMEKLLSTSSELYQHNHRVFRSRSVEWFQFGYMLIPKENWKMKDTSSSCRTSSLLLISDEPLLSITV